ncbi:molybdopterin-dependent oxidoreductase [Marisediminicola senii]|uniref:molybdopterin-dependent oxidoreductase n=1 Tax=Marisediminicola senii TaxID=2711233 RepID=UPI001F2F7DBE|nr:molybdopterin-dependent oxidoreductase [Marisediminicola senii]
MTSLAATRPAADQGIAPTRLAGWAAVAGTVSALLTLAVAEVVSLLFGGIGNPILAVGSLVIDLVPAGIKDLVIALFDTADKLVLFLSLGAVVVVLAVAAGILQLRRPPWGIAVLGSIAALAVFAAVTRADASILHALPTVAGALAGATMLRLLVARLVVWDRVVARRAHVVSQLAERGQLARGAGGAGSAGGAGEAAGSARDLHDGATADMPLPVLQAQTPGVRYARRSFLRMVVVVGVGSALVGAGARVMSAAATAVSDLRDMIRLPGAADPAPAIPDGGALDIAELTPYVTPNDQFYRIDTALQVPSLDPAGWRLRVTGMVDREVEIGFDELLAMPLVERYVTLACVSNTVGGDLIGNALWLGYPIREVLAMAGPSADADMVLSTSSDGFTASTPLEVLQDDATDALLAVGMNGEPLPLQHGFPVRMVVPGLYGYVSATKWVVELKVTTFADDIAYWTPRGWSDRGPIKLSSRIDTPRSGVDAGDVVVAGVAWAQHIGVSRVEVRIDDGAWREADLAREVTVDSWLQWSYPWDATPGDHRITVRATDAAGLVQTEVEASPAPNGSSGLHSVTVSVS